ncbi:tagaturonate reductase [Peptoniphilus equinus]|uniref:Tagaturonate reductase n=1 Tax=Peptoniphilus equinus TaxID=3016343 RepID=A0ABY7QVN2_9FIRM|nr:tagaturonate reductase [Peptoniphilus equinus]WBW50416.1 tagaturonate reductase [Peptoniphilus equinus]
MKINEKIKKDKDLQESILQFGEGNFLRAFVDWMVDLSNDKYDKPGSIVIVQPIEHGLVDLINSQDGLYTLSMRGSTAKGKKIENRIIKSVSRGINPYTNFGDYVEFVTSENLNYVISNTTEAGIVYQYEDFKEDEIQDSFPAKVAQLLYFRFKHFNGEKEKGLIFLPVELIDDNGYFLKKYVLKHIENWNLGVEFKTWVEESNLFTSTLVDRIVTGRPSSEEAKIFSAENGYEDKLLVFSELFNLWVIEGDKALAGPLTFDNLPCNVIWTDDVKPYKKRKVRILNGGHTSTVPAAVIAGYAIVRDFMQDEIFLKFFDNLIDTEVIPTIDLPRQDLVNFKKEVTLRFNNPYVEHKLLDITLNSVSKFNARCLPSIIDYYYRYKTVPKHFAFSLAALLRFYNIDEIDGKYIGKDQNGRAYEVKDDQNILRYFAGIYKKNDFVEEILKSSIWDYDLSKLGDFNRIVQNYYDDILNGDIRKVMDSL